MGRIWAVGKPWGSGTIANTVFPCHVGADLGQIAVEITKSCFQDPAQFSGVHIPIDMDQTVSEARHLLELDGEVGREAASCHHPGQVFPPSRTEIKVLIPRTIFKVGSPPGIMINQGTPLGNNSGPKSQRSGIKDLDVHRHSTFGLEHGFQGNRKIQGDTL